MQKIEDLALRQRILQLLENATSLLDGAGQYAASALVSAAIDELCKVPSQPGAVQLFPGPDTNER